MQKSRFKYCLFIMFLLCGWLIGNGNVPVRAESAKIIVSVANVRSGPGTQYEVAGNILQDSQVEIIEASGEWYRIRFSRLEGWVHKSLLDKGAQERLIISEDLVNLRSGPGTSYALDGQLKRGSVVTLLDTVGDWYKVKTEQGLETYIFSELVTEAASSNDPVPPVDDKNVPLPTPPADNDVKPIQVFLDGQELQFSDAVPMIENGRTLVPLRTIFEAMGATVEWDEATRTVKAFTYTTTVVLPIDSLEPTVNGLVWNIDVPAQIVNSRTLAPLRFVGEALGGLVAWDSTARRVNITSPVSNHNPPVGNNTSVTTIQVKESLVNLRSGPSTNFQSIDMAAAGERLSVVGERDGWYQVSRGGQRTAWIAGWTVDVAWEANEPIEDENSGQEEPEEPEVPDDIIETPEPPVFNGEVMHIGIRKADGEYGVVMSSVRKLDADIDKDKNIVKYFFSDVHLLKPVNLEQELGIGKFKVKGENQEDGVEVTIEVPEDIEYELKENNQGKENILSIKNMIIKVGRQVYGDSGERIMVQTLLPVEYEYDISDKEVEITLSGISQGAARDRYDYVGKVLDYMKVKETSVKVKSKDKSQDRQTNIILQVKTKKDCKFNFIQTDDGILNIVATAKDSQEVPRGNIVVLDPGHGGSDSGAIRNGVKEKDIVLQIALKTGKILERKGIKVSYTRSSDTTVSLEERSNIANRLNAALFVSIHANANTSPTPSGTETHFYAPLSMPSLFEQRTERSELAAMIQTQITKQLKRIDRGVKESNFSVLRNTKMPSVLVETAFLSNPEELALLCSDSFQQSAAEGIAAGIEKYLQSK